MKLGEIADAQPAGTQVELYDNIREALKQALSETLAQLASRETAEKLLAQLVAKNAAASRTALAVPSGARCEVLTARELEILKCIASGDSNKEIARTFDLSVHTVKRHVANILGKLGATSRVQAATWLSARH
jgi:LuxR family maltose regulon positive regulatory protein